MLDLGQATSLASFWDVINVFEGSVVYLDWRGGGQDVHFGCGDIPIRMDVWTDHFCVFTLVQ